MKYIKIILISIAIFLTTMVLVNAAPYYTFTRTQVPEADNAFDLGTSTLRYRNFWGINATTTSATSTNFASTIICLTGDTCRTTWPSAGASFGQTWEIGGNSQTGFLAPTTTQKVWIGQASSTVFSANQLEVGGTATTTFTPAGLVGIGTTTPWATLAVNPLAGQAVNRFAVGSSTATSFIIKNDGKIGVGSTTPYVDLGVTGTTSVDNLIISSFATAGAIPYATSTGKITYDSDLVRTSTTSGIAGIAGKYISYGPRTLPTQDGASPYGSATAQRRGLILYGDTGAGGLIELGSPNFLSPGSFVGGITIHDNDNWKPLQILGTKGSGAGEVNLTVKVGGSTKMFFGATTNFMGFGPGSSSFTSQYPQNAGSVDSSASWMINAETSGARDAGFSTLTSNFTGGGDFWVKQQSGQINRETVMIDSRGTRSDIANEPNNSGFQFRTSTRTGSTPIDALRIARLGNVGIGSTTPFARLSVHGDTATTTGYIPTLFAVASSTPTATTTLFVVNATGKVGVGTTSPATTLHVTAGLATTTVTVGELGGAGCVNMVKPDGTMASYFINNANVMITEAGACK